MLLDNYVLISELGTESKRKMNRVFKMKRKVDGKDVIVKIFQRTNEKSHLEDLFRKEASFQFKHPSLPQENVFFETDSELIFITAFKNGTTIEAYWNKLNKKQHVKQHVPFLLSFFSNLESVFEELQAKNIVHGDLKPSNILIEGEDLNFKVHLLDFGLAIQPSNSTDRGTLFALGYSAPELILGKYHLTNQQTDIFSLGCIIYKLYTKTVPLTHPNPAVMTNLQITHPLMKHPEIPTSIFELVSKMCSKYTFEKPPHHFSEEELEHRLKLGMNQRYQNLKELINDLVKISENQQKSWFSKLNILRK